MEPIPSPSPTPNPAQLPLRPILDRARRELLDLSNRNRLLAVPIRSKSARLVQVHDERASEIFRLLVEEGKALSFLPSPLPTPSSKTHSDPAASTETPDQPTPALETTPADVDAAR
ncbi:MAG: DUF4011 domain-containing protein, partial [Limisphaerales bacterium]